MFNEISILVVLDQVARLPMQLFKIMTGASMAFPKRCPMPNSGPMVRQVLTVIHSLLKSYVPPPRPSMTRT